MQLNESKFFSELELKRLLKTISETNTKSAMVDRFLYELLLSTGMRISEAIHLKSEDLSEGYILLKSTKAGIPQTIPLGNKIKLSLAKYEANRPYPGPWLFQSQHGDRIRRETCHARLKEWLRKAGVNRPGLSLHSFRHTHALRSLESGIPLNMVQKALRHSNISTTSRYLSFTKEALEKYKTLW